MIRDGTEIERTKRVGLAMEMRGLLQAAKARDPVAAAAGAVALLGIDQAEWVHSWLRTLANRFPWLADGAALAAESSARMGNHADAVALLLLLEGRGIPLFSDSLAFALDRLTNYERSRDEPVGDRAAIHASAGGCNRMRNSGSPGALWTTFRALDPTCRPTSPAASFYPLGFIRSKCWRR